VCSMARVFIGKHARCGGLETRFESSAQRPPRARIAIADPNTGFNCVVSNWSLEAVGVSVSVFNVALVAESRSTFGGGLTVVMGVAIESKGCDAVNWRRNRELTFLSIIGHVSTSITPALLLVLEGRRYRSQRRVYAGEWRGFCRMAIETGFNRLRMILSYMIF
jgi:hypothetical protein